MLCCLLCGVEIYFARTRETGRQFSVMTVVFRHLWLVVLLAAVCSVSPAQGQLTLTWNGGDSIPTDGSGRILITELSIVTSNQNPESDAVLCRRTGSTDTDSNSNWFVHPDSPTTSNQFRVAGITVNDDDGWGRNRGGGVVRLWRGEDALEGVFTCRFPSESNIHLGIYYCINSVTASIEVESLLMGTFRVRCTSSGGRALEMTVTGPGGTVVATGDIEPVGTPGRTGSDSFIATTGTITGGNDGDSYQCTASNGVASDPTDDITLRVAATPTITSADQVSPGSAIRVTWSQPTGGAPVTRYIVFYSIDGVRFENVTTSDISKELTGLMVGETYTIIVVAESEHLSGVSESVMVELLGPPDAPANPRSEVMATAVPPSVTVSWDPVSGADSYTVSFIRARDSEQMGLCLRFGDNMEVTSEDTEVEIVLDEEEAILHAYSTYSYSVTAVSNVRGESDPSPPETLLTPQIAATAPPRNVRTAVVNSTTITVQWDPLDQCRDANGLITMYTLQFQGQSRETLCRDVDANVSTSVPGQYDEGGQTIVAVVPFTDYSIRVAAVNEEGEVGVFSNPETERTPEDVPGPVTVESDPSFFTILFSWDCPERPNGVITQYEVEYLQTNQPPESATRMSTNLVTNFTVSELDSGTEIRFSVRAYTRLGAGDWTFVTATTLSSPSAVEGVEVSELNRTAVTVSWNPLVISGFPIANYTVEYSRVSGRSRRQDGVMSAVFPPDTTSGVIGGLSGPATYQFQVYATVVVNGRALTGDPSPVDEDSTISVAGTEVGGGSGSDAVPGIVAGVIVAILVVLIIIAVVVLVLWYFRRRGGYLKTSSPYKSPSDTTPLPLTSVHYTKATDNMPNGDKTVEPVIEKFPEESHAMEGEAVLFAVKVKGTPQPKLTWYHNGVIVTADYSTELAENGNLTIFSAEMKHTGIYQLVAQNMAGSMEREVKLFVKKEGQPSPYVARKQINLSAIPTKEFGEFVARSHANNNREFRDQYTELDKDEHPTTIGSSPGNKLLNRFANITVYDNNRITLRPIEGHSDCQREFINACYIDGYKFRNKFIATQGPLPKTVVDFWRLVWQEKPPTIVMVTKLKEGTKIKCQQYWPESGASKYGPFQVTITDQQHFADYVIRTLTINLTDGSERPLKVTQFHFTSWPDHGVPDYATPILAFHKKIKKHHRPSKGPMLIHCSAGVGRTGTLVTIDRVLDQIQKEDKVDIAGTIRSLRNQRMKMVQNPEQYIFINDAVLEAMTCGDTQIAASDLRRVIQKMSIRDPKTRANGFETQFKVLNQVTPKPDEVKRIVALQNPTRNRSEDFLPVDRWRVVLKGDTEDYIHASVVNGYKQQRAYIIAQGPMESTARDFWKMVYDKKCGVIVMLSDLKEDGKEVCHQYWPNKGLMNVGEYTVDLLGEENLEGFVLRTLSVLENKSNKAHQIVQFHMNCWSPNGHCSNLTSVIDVIDEVGKVQRRTGNHPILVHCSDTVSRSGMFCAIATTIERCKTEGVVDVFQVVKALRVQKPGAVQTVDQFRILFEAVLVYLDSFQTYGNFQEL